MAIDRDLLRRAFVRAAKLHAPSDPKSALEALILGRFTSEATDGGKTIIASTEAGGSITFHVPPDFGPADVMALAEDAIEWIDQQPDPDNPDLSPRRVTRLRANFRRARL